MITFKPFDSKHFVRDAQQDVQAICAPLFKSLGLSYFHYSRMYRDGSFAILYSRMDWSDHFYRSNFRIQLPLTTNDLKLGKHHISLWQGVIADRVIRDARNFYNIEQPLGICIPRQDHFESFAFAAPQGSVGIVNTYFNHIETLLRFTDLFRNQAAKLIQKTEQNRVIVPPEFQSMQLKLLDKISAEITVEGKLGPAMLSFKELEVLKLLCQGLTMKEVANKLYRSPRTVEMHLNHLKSKLGCEKKSQLIALALNSQLVI